MANFYFAIFPAFSFCLLTSANCFTPRKKYVKERSLRGCRWGVNLSTPGDLISCSINPVTPSLFAFDGSGARVMLVKQTDHQMGANIKLDLVSMCNDLRPVNGVNRWLRIAAYRTGCTLLWQTLWPLTDGQGVRVKSWLTPRDQGWVTVI